MVFYCKGCGVEVQDTIENYEMFEGMHWLCFHYAYEHSEKDPDIPCDSRHCPTWHLEILKRYAVSKGDNPEEIINKAIEKQWSKNANR